MTTPPDYSDAIFRHRLPSDFAQTISQWYQPLARKIVQQKQLNQTLTIGINGSQGSGKSTLADFLKLILKQEHNLNTAVVSIDDFYLTLEERQQLASDVHPLFATRGVPGTHDIPLALETLSSLRSLKPEETIQLPSFDKATDDRAHQKNWPDARFPVDVVILEGWCVAAIPQQENELQSPINDLESSEDPTGAWRQYVNLKLSNEYQTLFNQLDHLVMLQAPSFSCVHEWRLLQETKLIEKWTQENPSKPARLLESEALQRFISHYQRLTEHCLATLPNHCDWLLPLNIQHQITHLDSPMCWKSHNHPVL